MIIRINKYYLFLILLFLQFNFLYGQSNLVPNPSFEELIRCPNYQFDRVIKGWFPAAWDAWLFTKCANWPNSVPHNNFNKNVYPRTGDSYIMIGSYTNLNFALMHTRMQAKLIKPLERLKQYYIFFYTRPVLNLVSSNELPCFADGAGLAFMDTVYTKALDIYDTLMPPYKAVVENPQGNLLDDTTKWTLIDGKYTANGSEKYILIGNFRPLYQQLTNKCNPNGNFNVELNFDDIGVFEFDPVPDTLYLCYGDSKTVGHSFLNANFLWNTGAKDSTIEIKNPGIYKVKAFISDYEFQDSVIVLPASYMKNIYIDNTICKGEVLSLNPALKGNYEWSNGIKQNSINVTKAGEYIVTISNECGKSEIIYNIQTEKCDCDIFIPNIFSPNGDGVNDEIQCYINCDFPFLFKKFEIFNRWGERLYSSNSEAKWDGSINGSVANNGVYIWYLEYEQIRAGKTEKILLTGDITISK